MRTFEAFRKHKPRENQLVDLVRQMHLTEPAATEAFLTDVLEALRAYRNGSPSAHAESRSNPIASRGKSFSVVASAIAGNGNRAMTKTEILEATGIKRHNFTVTKSGRESAFALTSAALERAQQDHTSTAN